MANAGVDQVYHNTGRERAEAAGRRINEDPSRSGDVLSREANRGTASERQALWREVLRTNGGSDTAQQHLPQGFTVSGEDGSHVVKNKNGQVIFDEAKNGEQVRRDSQIRGGEGPYQALIRQGMTPKEAQAAARDMKTTTGTSDKGFKQGDDVSQQQDGKGSWHRFDRSRSEQAGLAAVDAENRRLTSEQNRLQSTVDTLGAGSRTGGRGFTKEDIQQRFQDEHGGRGRAGRPLSDEQRKNLEFMRDHFQELAGPGGNRITEASLKRYYDQKRKENFL